MISRDAGLLLRTNINRVLELYNTNEHTGQPPVAIDIHEQGTKHPTGSALLLLNIVFGKGLAAIEEGLTLNQNRQPFRSVRMKKKAHPELEIGGRIGG